MGRERLEKERDCRFDDWRRNTVEKGGRKMNLPLYSTDIDGIEYRIVNNEVVPVALIEKKNKFSRWKEYFDRQFGIHCQFKLSEMCGIPLFVAEHSTDCSMWTVYLIESAKEPPNSNNIILDGSLYDYVMFLCDLHKFRCNDIIKQAIRSVDYINEHGESEYYPDEF